MNLAKKSLNGRQMRKKREIIRMRKARTRLSWRRDALSSLETCWCQPVLLFTLYRASSRTKCATGVLCSKYNLSPSPTFPSKDEWQGITMCPACDTVGYCGPRCREAARPRHQVECSLLVLRGRKTWPHRAWFLARACLRLDAEGWDERDRINSTKSRAFRDLLDRKFSTLHVRLEHILCRLQ